MKNQTLITIISAVLLTIGSQASAQQALNSFTAVRSHTHALIIGISDYAHIEDLEYADKDAAVFRDYLMNTMENQADSNNIAMLLNKDAVSPVVYKALENLVSMAAEGDKVYIYFSGHGDSENTTIFRSGFLLTYDTPAGTYYTNSVNVDILNNFINTLSARNKADVIFIADACRSGSMGQLAANGAVQTARSLTQSVADEVRLLSCQPEEISLEGGQWGNGRGLFSYHLINGLYGLADLPSGPDGKVILNELNVYLGIYVPRDAQPVSQYPGVYGPMNKVISRVDPDVLKSLMENEGRELAQMMAPTNGKGYEERFLASLDAAQQVNYKAFHKALAQGNIREPEMKNAMYYLEALEQSGIDTILYTLLERNLAAALQEQPQLFIHQLLDVEKRWDARNIKYGQWSRDILTSAEILGEGHYLYKTLMGKYHFLSAADKYYKAKAADQPGKMKMLASEALKEIDAAIEIDPLAAYYHNLKGITASLINFYEPALAAFEEAIRINPDYPYPYANRGYAHLKAGQYEDAIEDFNTCISLDPEYTNAYQYKITALKKLGREAEALEVYDELLKANSLKGM